MQEDQEVLDRVIKGTAQDIRALFCPKCSAGLAISFHRGSRVASVKIQCKTCTYILRAQIPPSDPPWVSQIGTRFETTR